MTGDVLPLPLVIRCVSCDLRWADLERYRDHLDNGVCAVVRATRDRHPSTTRDGET